jgi:hypothetical protein
MTRRSPIVAFVSFAVFAVSALLTSANVQAAGQSDAATDFRTADRCASCHGNLKTAKGETFSFNLDAGSSIMANAARDPYWQGSVRREVTDHPEASEVIQNDCATCHMPLQHLQDAEQGHQTDIFKRLPLNAQNAEHAAAADGVSCTVCHQIQPTGLGTPATYSGNFAVAPAGTTPWPLFGPFGAATPAATTVHVKISGYAPVQSDHMREAALCGSCHTLYTPTLGPGGKAIGQFPEQMTYLEWLRSDYHAKQTCQQCHMPAVDGSIKVSSVLGTPREGVRQHTFIGANAFMLGMLGDHRDDLAVTAQPDALKAEVAHTTEFAQSQSARVTLSPAQLTDGKISFSVRVENLTGHKLPTAYPSRRAWLHVVVTAADGHAVFESGKLNADGSIVGNVNDADATRYLPHFTEITSPDQVEIFEPILGDGEGHVTTGLLMTTQYLKDNRILPSGFDKKDAPADIAVHGKAADDPDFTGGSSTTHYAVATSGGAGPYRISAELIYQPIGFRWAHNLASYKAAEPQRFVDYYEKAASQSAMVLAHAEGTAQAASASIARPGDSNR